MMRDTHEQSRAARIHPSVSAAEETELLERIRQRAYAIHLHHAERGQYRSAQDDWLEAESQVRDECAEATCYRVLDHRV